MFSVFFFFNDTATTEIYTLSLHDALPISQTARHEEVRDRAPARAAPHLQPDLHRLRPHSRVFHLAERHDDARGLPRRGEIGRAHVLNSSHANISYAVFCLKKNKNINTADS